MATCPTALILSKCISKDDTLSTAYRSISFDLQPPPLPLIEEDETETSPCLTATCCGLGEVWCSLLSCWIPAWQTGCWIKCPRPLYQQQYYQSLVSSFLHPGIEQKVSALIVSCMGLIGFLFSPKSPLLKLMGSHRSKVRGREGLDAFPAHQQMQPGLHEEVIICWWIQTGRKLAPGEVRTDQDWRVREKPHHQNVLSWCSGNATCLRHRSQWGLKSGKPAFSQ